MKISYNMDSIKISIIIPVFNCANYIERCLKSIISQKSNEIEVIIVNDGSTDKTSEICDIYSSNNSYITTFHQINKGVSSARNLGIEKANGEWVFFVDADDYLPENAINTMKDAISKYNIYDLIHFNINIEKNNLLFSRKDFKDKTLDISKYDVINDLLNYNIITGPFAKLFRRSIIANTRFNKDLKIGEDLLFNIEYLLKMRTKAIFLDKVIYTYFINNNSVMQSSSTKYITEYETLTLTIRKFLIEKDLMKKYEKTFHAFSFKNLFISIEKSHLYMSKEIRKQLLSDYEISYSLLHDKSFFIKVTSLSRGLGNAYLFYSRIINRIKSFLKSYAKRYI